MRECDIELAATMIQKRKDMRRILGDKYEASSRDWRAYLPAIHLRFKGRNLLESVMRQMKEMDAKGADPSMLICAYLDEMEATHA